MSNHHNCPGLVMCGDHPKPRIFKIRWNNRWVWAVFPPITQRATAAFPSHAEAINHAQQAARKATR